MIVLCVCASGVCVGWGQGLVCMHGHYWCCDFVFLHILFYDFNAILLYFYFTPLYSFCYYRLYSYLYFIVFHFTAVSCVCGGETDAPMERESLSLYQCIMNNKYVFELNFEFEFPASK